MRQHLESEPGLTVVGEADSGQRALALVEALEPDVLLLDMEMPGLGGLDVVERLSETQTETAVVILSAYEDEAYVLGVLDAGAAGYLSKQEPLSAISEAVRGAAHGHCGWLSHRIRTLYHRRTWSERTTEADWLLETLTPREREAVTLVGLGLTNHEIADRLFVSESTVKKHVHALYSKLDFRTRPQIVVWAWRTGLVSDETPDA